MFGFSIQILNEWANRAYIIFGMFAIIATAGALAASFVMWRTSDAISAAKDEAFNAFKIQSSTDIARAVERTAELQNANLKLEEQIAPRRFKPTPHFRLEMSRFSGMSVEIKSYSQDVEAAILGGIIITELQKAGVTTFDSRMTQSGLGGLLFDMNIKPGNNFDLHNTLLRELRLGGLSVQMLHLPQLESGFAMVRGGPPADLELFIGAKPPLGH